MQEAHNHAPRHPVSPSPKLTCVHSTLSAISNQSNLAPSLFQKTSFFAGSNQLTPGCSSSRYQDAWARRSPQYCNGANIESLKWMQIYSSMRSDGDISWIPSSLVDTRSPISCVHRALFLLLPISAPLIDSSDTSPSLRGENGGMLYLLALKSKNWNSRSECSPLDQAPMYRGSPFESPLPSSRGWKGACSLISRPHLNIHNANTCALPPPLSFSFSI
jgi:hypothetical protein